MKIIMYSVRPDEQPAIQEWATKHDAQVDTTSESLDSKSVDQAQGYDALVVAQHAPFGEPEVYQKIAAMGIHHIALRITGYNIIDFDAAKKNHIVITNVPAYSPRSVAEEALAHTMIQLRHLKEAEFRIKQHDFSWNGLESHEIHNLTVGILGAGKIGGTVARLFKALGARVIANDIVKRPELADTLDYVSLNELLQQSDILTVHTNLDNSTHHIIDAGSFKKMKNSAIIINCARGPIIDTEALLNALDNGEIAAAGLDTVEGEETVVEKDLRTSKQDFSLFDRLSVMPNVSLTPHIGFYTDAAVKNMVEIALNDVELIHAGKEGLHTVEG